jgi:YHS domain-containing protein
MGRDITIVNCSLYLFIDPRYGMFKDPVCKMMVDEKKTKFVSDAGGRKVYLCSAMCKGEFDRNPAKYGY